MGVWIIVMTVAEVAVARHVLNESTNNEVVSERGLELHAISAVEIDRVFPWPANGGSHFVDGLIGIIFDLNLFWAEPCGIASSISVIVFSSKEWNWVIRWVSWWIIECEQWWSRLISSLIDFGLIKLHDECIIVTFNHLTRGSIGEHSSQSIVECYESQITLERFSCPNVWPFRFIIRRLCIVIKKDVLEDFSVI